MTGSQPSREVPEPDPNVYVKISEIVSSTDIARILQVMPSAVSNWKKRDPTFPAPFKMMGDGSRIALYRRSEVLEWYTQQHMTPDIRNVILELADRIRSEE